MNRNNIKIMQMNNGRRIYLLPIALLAMLSCEKQAISIVGNNLEKRSVVDYILDRENMYLIQYRFEYNENDQVSHIFRGERFAKANQLQLIATAFYSGTGWDDLPDSLQTYNTKGFQIGTIYAQDFNSVPSIDAEDAYVWPVRRNKLLEAPGGRLAMAIAGKPVNWSGSGHIGSGNEISILENIALISRSAIADSVQVAVVHPHDESISFDHFFVQYNNYGYPIDVSFYDPYNAGFERLKINYREE